MLRIPDTRAAPATVSNSARSVKPVIYSTTKLLTTYPRAIPAACVLPYQQEVFPVVWSEGLAL